MPYKIDSQIGISHFCEYHARLLDFHYQFYSQNVSKLVILTKFSEIYISQNFKVFQNTPSYIRYINQTDVRKVVISRRKFQNFGIFRSV